MTPVQPGEVGELALKLYKERMNPIMSKSYLTFMEITNYHTAVVGNVLKAVEQSLLSPEYSSTSNPDEILQHLIKMFKNQLNVCLLKQKQKVDTIGSLVDRMRNESLGAYDSVTEDLLRTLEGELRSGAVSNVFLRVAGEAKRAAVEFFEQNCHFSSPEAIKVDLEDKEEELLYRFREQYGEVNLQKLEEEVAVEEVKGETDSPSRIASRSDSAFSELSEMDSLLHQNGQHPTLREDSTLTSGFDSFDSSTGVNEIINPAVPNQNIISSPHSRWLTFNSPSRRGSAATTLAAAVKAFATVISVPSNTPKKSTSRLVIFFGSSQIYARFFDDANGKTMKSAQTIEPYILVGHQKLIGNLARSLSVSENAENVLDLILKNPRKTPNNQKLSAEETLAEFLRQIHLTLAEGDPNIQEFIIIYPTHLTHFQKRRLSIAADLADFKNTIFLSLHSFLSSLQIVSNSSSSSSDSPQDSYNNAMILHFSPRAFDVIVANLNRDHPCICSYSGTEDLKDPAGFERAHSYLINFSTQHPDEDAPVPAQRRAVKFYKEIINMSLSSSKIDWPDITNLIIIYDPPDLTLNLDTAFDTVNISEDLSEVELDESEVLNHALVAEATFEQALEIQDIYPRNFGLVLNDKVVEFFQEKNTPLEEEEKLEFLLDNVVSGWNTLIVGSDVERETYCFQLEESSNQLPEVVVSISSDPVFLYSVSISTSDGESIEVENITFPYLCEL